MRRKRNRKQDAKPEISFNGDPSIDLKQWLEEAKSRSPIPIINTDDFKVFFRNTNQEEQD